MGPGTHQAINLWVPDLFGESNTNIGESSAGIDSFAIELGIRNNDAKENFFSQEFEKAEKVSFCCPSRVLAFFFGGILNFGQSRVRPCVCCVRQEKNLNMKGSHFFNKPLIIPTRFSTNIERWPKKFLLLSCWRAAATNTYTKNIMLAVFASGWTQLEINLACL